MKSKVELETVATIIDELDYYKILKISRIASIEEIRDAFHREALDFHPDQYANAETPESQILAKRIYQRIVKAYQTLSNSKRRNEYDRSTGPVRNISDRRPIAVGSAEVNEDAITGIQSIKDRPKPGPGKKFYDLAQKAFIAKNLKAARMNVEIALGQEPGNPQYQQLKSRIQNELSKAKGT